MKLPYYGVNIVVVHGLFNNSASISRTPNVYLEKLNSLYDLDLFSLNTGIDTSINPDSNILNQHFRSLYYSPNSFYNLKCSLALRDREWAVTVLELFLNQRGKSTVYWKSRPHIRC